MRRSPTNRNQNFEFLLENKLAIAYYQRLLECSKDNCFPRVPEERYMRSLLQPEQLLNRIELYVEEKMRLRQLPKRSFSLLKEAVLMGEFERGKAAELTGYQERQGRTVLNQLVKAGLLVSDTPRGVVRLGFPSECSRALFS